MSSPLLWSLSIGEPGLLQTPSQRRQELARDLAAAGSSGDRPELDTDAYATKPTVLRRLAALLAEHVYDVDRLAARQGATAAVAAALALETGLAFVIITETEILGELHPGERVLLIEDLVEAAPIAEALAALRKIEATPAGVLAVLAEQHTETLVGEDDPGYEALFTTSELSAGTHSPLRDATGIREEGQG